MKKLLCILCLGVFLGACASVSNVESDNHETEKRLALSQIHKKAKILSSELEEKEKQNTLNEDEKELVQNLKTWHQEKNAEMLIKYSSRPITSVDILTIGLAHNEAYSMEEIDKYLQLGLYVKNPYCENEFKSYKIFQVLPEHVLTFGCTVTDYDKCSTSLGKIFMFLKQENELYFDGKILTSPRDSCPTYLGIYKYESKDENFHTVPVLMFLPKTIDKAQLEFVQKTREESQKVFQ